jgi:hypothetical protein
MWSTVETCGGVRLQQVFCYRPGNKSGGLNLEDLGNGLRSTVSLPTSLARVPSRFQGRA